MVCGVVTYLLVGDLGGGHVGSGSAFGGDEVIAVDCGGARRLRQARRNELKHRHLGGSVLRGRVVKNGGRTTGGWVGERANTGGKRGWRNTFGSPRVGGRTR